MRISVRAATAADAGLIAELRESARTEADSYRGHIDLTDTPASDAVVLVDDETVGAASYTDDGNIRTVTFVHVHPDARGIGAGDALLGWIVSDARQKGMQSVRATALPGDRSTKNLFERNGLVARAIQVERKLR